MKRSVVGGLIMIVLGLTAAGLEPFGDLLGPVSSVESWSYEVEMKFGEPFEEETKHTLTLYDRYGNDIETIHYGKSGGVEKRYARSVDESGRIFLIEKYGRLGFPEETTRITFSGNIQRHRIYDLEGELIAACDDEVDSSGKQIRSVIYDVETGDVSSVLDFTYASNGEPSLTEMRDEDGDVMFTFEYRYDVDGMDAIGTTTVYLLGAEFPGDEAGIVLSQRDAHGNWTEKRHYEYEEKFGVAEWVLTDVHRRVIEYYQ